MNNHAGYDWRDVGEITRDASGRLAFPEVSNGPGLFRFLVEQAPGTEVYIGESVNLRDRMLKHFRTPHTGLTNVRVRESLFAHINTGRRVRLALITQADVTGNLSSKRDRLDAKRAMLEDAESAGHHVLNL